MDGALYFFAAAATSASVGVRAAEDAVGGDCALAS
jgi:hypothetical protein